VRPGAAAAAPQEPAGAATDLEPPAAPARRRPARARATAWTTLVLAAGLLAVRFAALYDPHALPSLRRTGGAEAAPQAATTTTSATLEAPRLRRSLVLAAAFVAVTVASFVAVGGDYLAFFGPRFLMPAFPFLLLLASAGLGNLCRWAGGRPGGRAATGSGRRRRVRRLAPAAAGALLLLANALWLAWPARSFDGAGLAELMAGREELGRYLGAATPPNAVMADGSAGIVPYLARRANIDMFGLADLHIGHMTPLPIGPKNVAHEKYDPRYVLRRRPDLLITYLDRFGTPKTAGLPRVKDWVWACYRPLVLLRSHPGPDGRRLLPSRVFTAELFDAGYATTVLERRHGEDAAHCAAYEAN